MARLTRSAVAGRTPGSSFTTRETVLRATPASLATSIIVGRRPSSCTPERRPGRAWPSMARSAYTGRDVDWRRPRRPAPHRVTSASWTPSGGRLPAPRPPLRRAVVHAPALGPHLHEPHAAGGGGLAGARVGRGARVVAPAADAELLAVEALVGAGRLVDQHEARLGAGADLGHHLVGREGGRR